MRQCLLPPLQVVAELFGWMSRGEGSIVESSHHFFEAGEIRSASWYDVAGVE